MTPDTSDDDAEAFTAICTLQTGRFQARTRYLQLGDVGLEHIAKRGWLVQQAAKLAFARIARTAHCMELDSRNIPLKPVRLTDLVNAGRADR